MRKARINQSRGKNLWFLKIMFLLSTALILVSGIGFTANAASVKLSKKKVTMIQGESLRLRLKGAYGGVEWSSTNSGIAEVNDRGLVNAVSPGRCRIKAEYGEQTCSCRIIVKALSFEKPALTMVCGRQQTLRFNTGKVTGAVWSSSNPKVASVENGLVTSKQPGKTVIRALWNEIEVKCEITVTYVGPETLKQAYAADKSNRGKIVLAGSSSMDYWMNASQAFSPYEVINTAIGGTTVMDWIVWYRTLITRYKPAAVVLYVGSNDLSNGERITGEENAQNTIQLLKSINRVLKNVPIFYVSINPCWSRKGAWDKITASNQLVKNFCGKKINRNLYYIDIVSAFLNADGTPNPSLFLSDQLHPSEKGYMIWEQLVARQVKQKARKSLREAQKKYQKSKKKM